MSSWQDAITDSFPPPHEREPSNLRADIRDELADHLECATRRELLKARDESVARQAALERFGDPKSIARRLWWDGMKGRIMKDRLFIVLFTFGVIAVLAAFLLPFAAKQNAINEAILAKLNTLSTSPPASRPALPENWASLKVAVREEGTGLPLDKVSVQLSGKPFTDSDKSSLNESTDAQGVASFGPIHPGPYTVNLFTTVDGDISLFLSEGVTLYAGQQREITFTRPRGNIASDLTLHVTAPDYLLQTGCIAVYEFSEIGPIRSESANWSGGYLSSVAVGLKDQKWASFVDHPVMTNYPPNVPGRPYQGPPCGVSVAGAFPIRWAANEYKITRISVCQPSEGTYEVCWYAISSVSPKNLTISVKPGSARVELPLPEELNKQVSVSPRLKLPVTCRFPGLANAGDKLLIQISLGYRELGRDDDSNGSSSELWFSTDGRVVPADQLRNPGRPIASGRQRLLLPSEPLKMRDQALLGVGKYQVVGFRIWELVKTEKGLAYELCSQRDVSGRVGDSGSSDSQRLEVRTGQGNAWTISMPPDLLKTCAVTTQPE